MVNLILAVSVIYNIHHSLKFKDRQNKKQYKYYFIVMSLILAIDNLLSFILYKIPYYKVLKLILLVWISIPESTGPRFIYNIYIKNSYKLFEGDLDAVISNFKGYKDDFKTWYNNMVKGIKKGEVEIELESNKEKVEDKIENSSDIDETNSVISDANE